MSKLLLFLIQIGLLFDYYSCGIPKKAIRFPPELAGTVLATIQKCQPETGIGADALLLIYDGKYSEDEKFKNFIFCSYKSSGFLRNDGHIDEDKAIRIFKNEPLVEEGIRRCSQEKGRNSKESLFKFYKCFVDTTPVRITF